MNTANQVLIYCSRVRVEGSELKTKDRGVLRGGSWSKICEVWNIYLWLIYYLHLNLLFKGSHSYLVWQVFLSQQFYNFKIFLDRLEIRSLNLDLWWIYFNFLNFACLFFVFSKQENKSEYLFQTIRNYLNCLKSDFFVTSYLWRVK